MYLGEVVAMQKLRDTLSGTGVFGFTWFKSIFLGWWEGVFTSGCIMHTGLRADLELHNFLYCFFGFFFVSLIFFVVMFLVLVLALFWSVGII
jgi:hypothetical protein